MKKIIVSVLIIAFFAVAVMSSAQEYKGPRIFLKEMRYDAGKVMQGMPVVHVFEIRNTGTETLVVERLQST